LTTYVVDASVAVKWFLPEEYEDAARTLLRFQHRRLAPDLILAEVGNALLRRRRTGEISERRIVDGVGLLYRLTHLLPIEPLVLPAVDIATKTGASVYNALYLALSIREDVPVVTADRQLLLSAREVAAPEPLWLADLAT
jgi:predicted nucleic acid-binding protein